MRRSRAAALGRSRGTLLRWTDAELESRMHAAYGANRFVNLEYAVPLDRCDQAIDALRALYRAFAAGRGTDLAGLPAIVLRPVGADDAGYLAAPKGQSVVYVDVPYVADLEATGFYAAIERTLIALGGRCSWSRLFYAPPEEFLKNYPDHHRFVAAKHELDPDNVFSNAFSDRICQTPAAS
jgi:FAD/FMN-containing dehydrogenase